MDVPSAPLSFALKPQPPSIRWPIRVLAVLFLLLPIAGFGVANLWLHGTVPAPLAIVLFIVVVAAGLAWVVAGRVVRALPPIVVDHEGIAMPDGRGGVRLLAWTDVIVVRATKAVLIVGGRQDAFGIARRFFVDADGPEKVEDAVRATVATRADGEVLLRRIEINNARAAMFQARGTPITWGVTAVCVAAFAAEAFFGALGDPAVLVRFGANAPELVRDGQWWRLVTGNLLHGSLMHVLMNLSALVSTGALLERWLGARAYVMLLSLSSIGGACASSLVGRATLSVGLSTGLFGLLGVLAWTSYQYRRDPLSGPRVSLRNWVLMLAINGALSLLPVVDGAAHVGGFISGALLAVLFTPTPRREALVSGRALSVCAALCTLVVAAGVIGGIVHGRMPHDEELEEIGLQPR